MRPDVRSRLEKSFETQVDLTDLGIEDKDLPEIFAEIKKTRPKLESLFLSKNNIGDQGAIDLGRELASFKHLSFLDLEFNNIGTAGATALVILQKKHLPNLKYGLFRNPIGGEDAIDKIEEKLGFKKS